MLTRYKREETVDASGSDVEISQIILVRNKTMYKDTADVTHEPTDLTKKAQGDYTTV